MQSPQSLKSMMLSAKEVLAARKLGRMALLELRRPVEPQPAPNAPHDGGTTWVYRPKDGLHVPYGTVGHLTVAEKTGLRCPFGQVGEACWVAEEWYCDHCFAGDVEKTGASYVTRKPTPAECIQQWRGERGEMLYYRAGGPLTRQMEACAAEDEAGAWKPPAEMPWWAARLLVEWTAVSVVKGGAGWEWALVGRVRSILHAGLDNEVGFFQVEHPSGTMKVM